MQDIKTLTAMTLFAIVAGVAIAAMLYKLAPSFPVYLHVVPAFGLGALITLYIAYWVDNHE